MADQRDDGRSDSANVAVSLTRRAFLGLAALGTTALVAQPSMRSMGNEAGRAVAHPATVGFVNHDLDARASSLGSWGSRLPYIIDFDYSSIGVDLGTVVGTNALRLDNPGGAHVLTSRDWSVYRSDDNRRWTKVPAAIVDLGDELWFLTPTINARYFKLHNHREFLTASTFSMQMDDLQSGMQAFKLGGTALLADGGGAWSTSIPVTVSTESRSELRDRCVYISHEQLGASSLIESGRLRADLADMRFADVHGAYLHAYADDSGVFVRIPQVAPGTITAIQCLCGNATARDVVHYDGAALQVEYGQRTLTRLSHEDDANPWGTDLKCATLPSGIVVVAGGWSRPGRGVGARYSRDRGRTFGSVNSLVSGTDDRYVYSAGSFHIDDASHALQFFFYRLGVRTDGDWLDPLTHDCTCWVAYASDYDAEGHPQFSRSVQLRPYSSSAEQYVSWALTYTNPVTTKRGTIVVPVAYAYKSDGSFALTVFRSTNHGTTWEQSNVELTIPGGGVEVGVSESALLVESDGTLRLFARGQAPGRFHMMTSSSSDDGVTWTPLTESSIISSNTMPAVARFESGRAALSWSGHNSLGQTSYWRNNLTMAHSDDDGKTWHGYHDLLGATSASLPGIGDDRYRSRVLEADSTSVGSDDRLVTWTARSYDLLLPDHGPRTLLVEDGERYLIDSHGALDMVRTRATDSALVAQGSELAHARWWRLGDALGTLDTAPSSRQGAHAVRFSAPPGAHIGGSRLFPAIRRGRVRFKLRRDSGAGIDIALQEAFGLEVEGPGTVVGLHIDPTGAVSGFTRARGDAMFGYVDQDVAPRIGNLQHLGMPGSIAFDTARRSIGAAFSSPADLMSVTLSDGGVAYHNRPVSRLRAQDLEVWVSENNRGDWRAVPGWAAQGQGNSITLTGPPVVAKYVKVTQPYDDQAFTFANDSRVILGFQRAQHPLSAGPIIRAGVWTSVELSVDLPENRIGVKIDCSDHGSLPVFARADVVTHLLTLGTSAVASTNYMIDELLVQDTDGGLPTIDTVGIPGAFTLA